MSQAKWLVGYVSRIGGVTRLKALATKNGKTVPVIINAGFTERTDGSIRIGNSVYPDDEPSKANPSGLPWTPFYEVLGHYFGGDVATYIADGVTFKTIDGRMLGDDATTLVEEAMERLK